MIDYEKLAIALQLDPSTGIDQEDTNRYSFNCADLPCDKCPFLDLDNDSCEFNLGLHDVLTLAEYLAFVKIRPELLI